VIRTLAALAVSQVVPGAARFREELAAAMGSCQSNAACLIDGYAAIAAADKVEMVERIDRVVSRSFPFGPWVRSLWLCLKLRVQGIRRSPGVDTEAGHPLWGLGLILREVAERKGKGT
jgi:hypothetical protein